MLEILYNIHKTLNFIQFFLYIYTYIFFFSRRSNIIRDINRALGAIFIL